MMHGKKNIKNMEPLFLSTWIWTSIYDLYWKFTSEVCKVCSPVSVLTVEPTGISTRGDIGDPHNMLR